MLTFEEAKKIGKNACIEMLGRSFYEKYIDSSTTAYGDFSEDGVIFCYVGVNDHPQKNENVQSLILSSTNPIPYSASCNVQLEDGKVIFLECKLPQGTDKNDS